MPDEPQQPEHKTRKRFGWGCAAIALFVFLSLYFLSFPFAFAIFGVREVYTNPILHTFYSPAFWLEQNVEFVSDFYEWYVHLFPLSWFQG